MNPDSDQLRVLIAEDTVVGRQVVSRILTEAGCQVSAVANGRGVLEMLVGSTFDLVIMDCMMPEMDGFAAARAIRAGKVGAQYSEMPIVAISGLASATDRQSCLEAGMDELVQKPITRDNLLPVVTAVLEARRDAAKPAASVEEDEAQSLLQSLDEWSPGFMDDIIDQFLKDVPSDIDALRLAMQEEDLEQLRGLAHRLRGSADVLSAGSLSKQASSLERACAQKDLALVRQHGPALIRELEQLVQA